METLLTTRKPGLDRSSSRIRDRGSAAEATAKPHPPVTRPRPADDSGDAAANAVAAAFARIVAERYPGTSWLPVKRSRGHNGLVVPAGKVLRLLPGPADMDPGACIDHAPPAAPE